MELFVSFKHYLKFVLSDFCSTAPVARNYFSYLSYVLGCFTYPVLFLTSIHLSLIILTKIWTKRCFLLIYLDINHTEKAQPWNCFGICTIDIGPVLQTIYLTTYLYICSHKELHMLKSWTKHNWIRHHLGKEWMGNFRLGSFFRLYFRSEISPVYSLHRWWLTCRVPPPLCVLLDLFCNEHLS